MDCDDAVRKIRPEIGDVLVFTGVDDATREVLMSRAEAGLFRGVLLVFLEPWQSLERLDETDMAEYGWTRQKAAP